jgi:hypothetical protein
MSAAQQQHIAIQQQPMEDDTRCLVGRSRVGCKDLLLSTVLQDNNHSHLMLCTVDALHLEQSGGACHITHVACHHKCHTC